MDCPPFRESTAPIQKICPAIGAFDRAADNVAEGDLRDFPASIGCLWAPIRIWETEVPHGLARLIETTRTGSSLPTSGTRFRTIYRLPVLPLKATYQRGVSDAVPGPSRRTCGVENGPENVTKNHCLQEHSRTSDATVARWGSNRSPI